MYLFQKQDSANQLLDSTLVSMSMTKNLQSRDMKNILWGLSSNTRSYVSSLKKRRYVEIKEDNLHLTAKSRKLIVRLPFNIFAKARSEEEKRELLLARIVLVCLYHLNHEQIEVIQTHELSQTGSQPDLSIVKDDVTIVIEIIMQGETIPAVQSKISAYNLEQTKYIPLFFTDSKSIYNYFQFYPSTNFYHLKSPTLIQDLLTTRMDFKNTNNQKTEKINQSNNQAVSNVKLKNSDLDRDIGLQDLEIKKAIRFVKGE